MTSAPTSGPAVTAKSRLVWVDTARGIGIILVVYAHVLRGQVSAKLLAPTAIEQLQDHAIYAFHMPFFFLLSGLFSGAAVRYPRRFLQRRFVSIAYPYLLWSIVQTSISIAADRYTNTPGTIHALAQIAVHPIGQFWFLYVLAILQLLLLLPRPIFYLLVPVGVLAGLEWGTASMLARSGWSLPFFAAGVFLGPYLLEAWLRSTRRALFWFISAALLFALLFKTPFPPTLLSAALRHYLLATAGSIAALSLARLIDDKIRILPMLGVASLAIFVLHVICGAATRAVLVKLGLHQPALATLLVTAAGLFMPLGVYLLSIRPGLTPWLGLGFPPASPTRLPLSEKQPDTPLEPAGGKADVGADQARGPEFP